ncbi:hypothetical protein VI817_010134 [Penicillium citrinum]|nr:hypothetical protein VI817_010134 [Penicillium citrinum]
MSLPTKRDEGHGFGLTKALGGLEKLPKLMETLDPQHADDKKKEDDKPAPSANAQKSEKPAGTGQEEKKVANQEAPKQEAPKKEAPTATEKKYSGNFATPTATHTTHPTSKPNALGALPIVGGLLGGTGGTL